MTVAIQLADRARTLALPGLVAAAATLLAAPAPAQDCELDDIVATTAVTDTLERVADNLECLAERVAALSAENAALRDRLDVLEDKRAAVAAAYRNVDGAVDRKGRYLGPATFVLTGDRQGRPRSLALDHDLVLAMCADTDGCLVTLGLTGAVIDGEPVETMFATGPCTLHLDADEGTWSTSGLCFEDPLPPAGGAPREPEPAASSEGTTATDPESGDGEDSADARAPDAIPRTGRDGNARPFGGDEQAAQMLLGFAGACFLAEAPPRTSRFAANATEPELARDTEADFFLVSAGTAWDPTGGFPVAHLPQRVTDPDFDCRLTLRD